MTFLDLQNKIIQTRKARKGTSNRKDYFEKTTFDEETFWLTVYQKALRAANAVVKHYEETEEISASDKIRVFFGEVEKQKHTYDPETEYLLSRQKAGRPKHKITPAEAQKIRELRESKWSINKIAKHLQINNRLIMAFCRENSL